MREREKSSSTVHHHNTQHRDSYILFGPRSLERPSESDQTLGTRRRVPLQSIRWPTLLPRLVCVLFQFRPRHVHLLPQPPRLLFVRPRPPSTAAKGAAVSRHHHTHRPRFNSIQILSQLSSVDAVPLHSVSRARLGTCVSSSSLRSETFSNFGIRWQSLLILGKVLKLKVLSKLL